MHNGTGGMVQLVTHTSHFQAHLSTPCTQYMHAIHQGTRVACTQSLWQSNKFRVNEVRASQLAQALERGWFSNTSFTTGLKTLPTFRPDALVFFRAKM